MEQLTAVKMDFKSAPMAKGDGKEPLSEAQGAFWQLLWEGWEMGETPGQKEMPAADLTQKKPGAKAPPNLMPGLKTDLLYGQAALLEAGDGGRGNVWI